MNISSRVSRLEAKVPPPRDKVVFDTVIMYTEQDGPLPQPEVIRYPNGVTFPVRYERIVPLVPR